MTLMNLMVGGPVGLLPHDWQKLAGTWVGVDRGTCTCFRPASRRSLPLGILIR
ncbi:hypothetical protein [Lacticaseibacillus camelliae]|uniref:hypothetical protein n=1 Tax=Lacticaseibacillus camelliae TaxID=381742 RepID=UPI001CDB1D71|nr:hypothetical protein [Lacticaseibacillus camelliae]